jgi:hypothetical protein
MRLAGRVEKVEEVINAYNVSVGKGPLGRRGSG